MIPEFSRPEFSRPERLDVIGEGERHVSIVADAAERAALATRFGLLSVDRLAADLTVVREGAGIAVRGRVTAAVVQACVASGEPVPADVDEPVALLFVTDDTAGEEEVELAPDALDTVEIEGDSIDLGEAAAETMALALDPFPRSAAAAAVLKDAGVKAEDEAALGPFGALAGLKAALERK